MLPRMPRFSPSSCASRRPGPSSSASPTAPTAPRGASPSTCCVTSSTTRRCTPMAHLTCVGSSYAEASQLIREFLDAGVTSFLALRGDPPAGVAEEDVHLGDLGSAAELVQLIHRVQKERVPFTLHDVPGFPGAKRVGRQRARDDRRRRVPERPPAVALAGSGHRHAARQAGGRREPRDLAAVLPCRRVPLVRRCGACRRRDHAPPARHHAGAEHGPDEARARAHRSRRRRATSSRASKAPSRPRPRPPPESTSRPPWPATCSTAASPGCTCTRSTAQKPRSPSSAAPGFST